ncbi:MAG TPA: hypothetical protein VFN94_01125 [Nitrospiria bacterium]|nr:hypothetical protein [Nitrospiria bacterium]
MNGRLCRVVWLGASALIACTHQSGSSLSHRPEPADVLVTEAGRSVFRFETFGNELFFSDTLGLDDGWSRLGITPNSLLEAGVQFDGDKLPADFRRVDVGGGPYTDPLATRRLIDANAVIGLVARQNRIGVTCAFCHSRADDRIGAGVGRRMDGAPNTALAVGEALSWASRSRAYLPFLNVSGAGSGPLVSLGVTEDAGPAEAAVDAALRAWPRGQADILPDGVGNPTEIPSLFAMRPHGPYLWDGSFAKATDASQYFATIVFDPTTLATRWGRHYLADGPFWPVGEPLSASYQGVLRAIDPAASWPRATIFRASVFNLFHDALDAGFRVDRDDIFAVTAYLRNLLPPDPEPADAHRIDAGRGVFRKAGCGACHLEGSVPGGAVVPLAVLVPGYHAPVATTDDPVLAYDDRIARTPGEDSIDRRGYKVPSLLGLWLSAPYLHDGSVATLDALFDPARGDGSPHPYVVDAARDRRDLAAFLNAWDGRRYP